MKAEAEKPSLKKTTLKKIMPQMSLQDESYLCLLCLRDSTERIACLYISYIKLRQSFAQDVPVVLFSVLIMLHEKYNGLEDKLVSLYPGYMTNGKWHNPEEQHKQLGLMTQESRDDLQQICQTEMKLLLLITEMMKNK